MKHDSTQVQLFLKNNLFAEELIQSATLYQTIAAAQDMHSQAKKVYDWLRQNFDAERFAQLNESQLEGEFLFPLYRQLGYVAIAQDGLTFQGKRHKLDALLFASAAQRTQYETTANIYQYSPKIIAEHKQWSASIDTNKVQHNPHHQLMQYLSSYRVNLGFLTNGRYWRFYDITKPSSEKRYYQIDLARLLNRLPQKEQDRQLLQIDWRYFLYFYGVFGASAQYTQQEYRSPQTPQTRQPESKQLTLQEQLQIHNEQAQEDMKSSLRKLIYSAEDSIVELVGQRLHTLYPAESLEELFRQSVIFALRLLFIAYFEQKHWDLLLQHQHYRKLSLFAIASDILLPEGAHRKRDKDYVDLLELLDYLAEGNIRRNIPLFNGGLFDKSKATMLEDHHLLTSQELQPILSRLYNYRAGQDYLARNLAQLSTQNIGEIYESLLDYCFRIETQKTIYYVEYRKDGRYIERYLDAGDWAVLQRAIQKEQQQLAGKTDKTSQKPKRVYEHIRHKEILPNTLYLVDGSMQRKQTASYYTPQELSAPLVKAALQAALQAEGQKTARKNPLELKVLDNACGSGHFLVDFLAELSSYCLDHIEEFSQLQAALAQEIKHIQQQVEPYIPGYIIDEFLVLKRLLLKKVIFGVDSNPLAVELSSLSLWLDTFIFGTPLSFIQHHIKCGNALLGSTIAEMRQLLEGKAKNEFFFDSVESELEKLSSAYGKIDSINDINPVQIGESYQIYQDVEAHVAGLRGLLHLSTAYIWFQGLLADALDTRFLPQPAQCGVGGKSADFIQGFHACRDDIQTWLEQPSKQQLSQLSLEDLARRYQFFHYDIEFPEVGNRGFDAIIGNPPWDKVLFSDDDFFPQYQSNYRTLSKGQKNECKETLLLEPSIQRSYDAMQQDIRRHAAYYKQAYPKNSTGHTNLFRLFMEKNLGLLAADATLNYLTPSAWSYEEGSTALRRSIFQDYQLRFFYQFENRKKYFAAVDSRYKFALYQIQNSHPSKRRKAISCHFMLQDAVELQEKPLRYPIKLIGQLDPEQQSLLEVRSKDDLHIAEKLYAQGRALEPSYLDFYQELNMTLDSDLFCEQTGYDQGYLPLYQGKHIHQFNHCYERPFGYYVEQKALEERLKRKEINRLSKALGHAKGLKKLGLQPEELEPFHRFNYQQPRLAFRDVARNTDERTVIMALLPPGASAGNTLWLSVPYRYSAKNAQVLLYEEPLEKLLWLQALSNNLILDFMARLMVDIHVNKTYFMRLPFIQPGIDELQARKEYRHIVGLSAYLNLAYDAGTAEAGRLLQSVPQLLELAQQYAPFRSLVSPAAQEKQQNQLRAELELAISELYGLNQEEMLYILSSFPVLERKQTAYCGLLREAFATRYKIRPFDTP